jgi:hypothetical protein
MGLAPTTLTVDEHRIALKPTLGIEKVVLISSQHALELGELEIMAANSGQWTPDPVNVPDTDGQDIIAVVTSPTGLDGDAANVVLAITGTKPPTGAITLSATFKPPAYARDASKVFEIGYAVDCIEAGGALVKTITGVTVSTAPALARGTIIKLYAMPALATFTQVGCATDVRWTSKSAVPVSIACGPNGTAFSKPGRSGQSSLTLNGKLFGFGDGLAKYDGRTCTVLIKIVKESKVDTDHLFFLESTLKVGPDLPDEGEATIAGEGVFEEAAFLVAM